MKYIGKPARNFKCAKTVIITTNEAASKGKTDTPVVVDAQASSWLVNAWTYATYQIELPRNFHER